MYKRFKRHFEQAARGQGSFTQRLLMLAFASPFYFVMRTIEAAYEYFAFNRSEKVWHMGRSTIASAISAGFMMEFFLVAAGMFLSAYIGISLTFPEVILASYVALVLGTQGMVKGKDIARVEALIHEDKHSPVRLEKIETDLQKSNEQKTVLKMYKLATQKNNIEPDSNTQSFVHGRGQSISI